MSTQSRTSAVSVDPGVMSGAPVFSGTRVLVSTFFDSLASGESVADFLDGFPQVTAGQVSEVLREAGDTLLAKHGSTPS